MNLVHELPVARQKEWLGLSLLIIGLLPVDLNTLGERMVVLRRTPLLTNLCGKLAQKSSPSQVTIA